MGNTYLALILDIRRQAEPTLPSIFLIINIGEANDQERIQIFNSTRMLAKKWLMIFF